MNCEANKLPFDLQSVCRLLFEDSPVATAVTEGTDRIGYVNPAFCLLVGRTQEELIGNPIAGAVPEAEGCLPDLEEICRTGKTETRVLQNVNTSRYWSCTIWPFHDAGQHVCGTVIQITDRTEDELFHQKASAMNQELMLSAVRQHEVEEALRQSEDRLKNSNVNLLQFAYVASHDLQSPLRNVEGFANIIARRYGDRLDEKGRQFIGYLISGLKDMQNMILDILEFAKIESADLTVEEVESSSALEAALANLEDTIRERDAGITIASPLPKVRGDLMHLTSLFQNLIGNAIKFSREKPDIHIAARKNDSGYLFSISDKGIGIDKQDAERIFEVFYRVHGKSEFPGTGVGLAIAKRIVERSGGRIWVESEVGKGTTFFFTLLPAEA